MKKGIYWFSFLNEKEQTEFRENCEDFHLYISMEYLNFKSFITNAFDWIETKQGNDYWYLIYNRKVK
jgi:hypothetical protein